MKTALRLSLGLLLTISAVGCHTCQSNCQPNCQTSCQSNCDSGCGNPLQKLFSKFRGGGCGGGGNFGCQSDCGFDEEPVCECGRRHHRHSKKSKARYDLPAEAAMYGYDKSVVYTGDDWQGIPQPAMGAGMMPMTPGCSGCAGGPPMMSMPSVGCSGCGGSGVSPIPNQGGCASCGGSGMTSPPQAAPGGCASCGGHHPTPVAASASSGCASCAAGATVDSFYNPLGPNHVNPAPVPPAEGVPPPSIESVPGGDKTTNTNEPIQKIQWVPRQL